MSSWVTHFLLNSYNDFEFIEKGMQFCSPSALKSENAL